VRLRDRHHFHPILAMPPGPDVAPALATGTVRIAGGVEHEHAVDRDAFGGRHFHSGALGPNGEPLGYSAGSLEAIAPPELQPSDNARVRVWDDRLRH
jgi:hypothetical protein